MCGRYSLTLDQEALNAALGVEGLLHPRPRFNVAPSQDAPVLVQEESGTPGGRVLRWGLVPRWADDPAMGHRLINARSESARTKPSFRSAFRGRRCLVPADGFFEWRPETRGKIPYWLHSGGDLLLMAGLWEEWAGEAGERLRTFSILTREASGPAAVIHHRMPVLLEGDLAGKWLDGASRPETLEALILETSPPDLQVRQVPTRVNDPAHDDESCIEPTGGGDEIPPPPEQTSLF